jgi:hypothetical protein
VAQDQAKTTGPDAPSKLVTRVRFPSPAPPSAQVDGLLDRRCDERDAGEQHARVPLHQGRSFTRRATEYLVDNNAGLLMESAT